MGINLLTQKELSKCRSLSFCYICGKRLAGSEDRNRDHVPPKNIFADSDRNPPLILPVHVKCNSDHSENDEIIGQLVNLLHGKVFRSEMQKIKFGVVPKKDKDAPLTYTYGVNYKSVFWRWIMGFHAALYRSPVASGTSGNIHLPFPTGYNKDNTLKFEPMPSQQSLFVHEIKRNRTAGTLDRIQCYNGKCTYECFWTQFDNSDKWLCVFALRLYDWENLGPPQLKQRGCVGFYSSPSDPPSEAIRATRILFALPNMEPLDPFGR